MKTRAMIVVATLALAGLSMGPVAMAHGDADETVVVDDYSYDPAVLTIEPGTAVKWINQGDEAHTVATHYHGMVPAEAQTAVNTEDPTSEADDFHAMLMPTDDPATHTDERTFTHTFETPGVYVINCNLGEDHETMRQVILVQ